MLQRSIIVAFVVFIQMGIAFGGPIDNLQPGQWYEVPNSALANSGVLPNPLPPGDTGPASIMGAWSGGAYDTKRDRLIVWGGGHGDYAGNELYAFDINTFKWLRIWGPSPNSVIPSGGGSTCPETYNDGNPASRHTYDGLVYLPTLDKFWASGGSLWCGSGGGSYATWMFDFTTSTWTRKTDAIGGHQVTAMSDYDPANRLVYTLVQNGTLGAYDPTNDSWANRGSSTPWAEFDPAVTMIYHPGKKMLLLIGAGIGGEKIYTYDMTQRQPNYKTVATTGGSAIVGVQGPGLAYDPTIDRIVAWPGGGSDVYSLDVSTGTWTKYTATNSVVPPTASQTKGTYGRWQYIPSKNAYIAVNSIYNNVFFYKLSSGGGTPPDATPPNAPKNPRTVN
jgi:hypothetical protein